MGGVIGAEKPRLGMLKSTTPGPGAYKVSLIIIVVMSDITGHHGQDLLLDLKHFLSLSITYGTGIL